MRPYYLDGDLAQHDPKVLQGPVIPVSAAAYRWRLIVASVQFSRTVERLNAGPLLALMEAITIASHELRADAGLSKLNSMLG
jgi:hypothetical protein